MELLVAFAVAVGAFTRLSAALVFFYTLGTALIGHRYWTMTGTERVDSMDGFYKNARGTADWPKPACGFRWAASVKSLPSSSIMSKMHSTAAWS
jgi:hypothetical protein